MSDLTDRLMQDFYLSESYDPKAERPADTVKAAIAFTLVNYDKAMSEHRKKLEEAVVARRIDEGTLSQPLDYTDWEEVSGEVDHELRRQGLKA